MTTWCTVYAQESRVSEEMAIMVAKNYMRIHLPEYNRNGYINTLINENGDPILYEYITDSISLLMSGNKNCLPILCRQKFNGSMLTDTNILPEGLKLLIKDYIDQIKYCYSNQLYDNLKAQEWEELSVDTLSEPLRIIWVVHPMLSTQWGQSESNCGYDQYAYNYYIRPDTVHGCEHCLVGCGAVAMAQVMKFWQHPLIRNDILQFDWCNMTNKLSVVGYNYETYRNAVAYLMLECASSMPTSYGCTATGSHTSDIRNALISFGYSSDAFYEVRGNNTLTWISKVKESLDNGYPVIYGGGTQFGVRHTFVCDGYSRDGLFHFNWGSVHVDPGECTLDNIAPTNNLNFSRNQEAIFMIHPVGQQDICNINICLEGYYYVNASLLNTYCPYEITPRTTTTLTSASISSPSSWRTIPVGVSAVYQAHQEVILRDGFEAQYGSEFEAKIEPCEQCEEMRGIIASQNDTREAVDNWDGLGHGDTVSYTMAAPQFKEEVDLFPNPTDGELTMTTNGMAEAVLIHDVTGRPVGGWRFEALTDTEVVLDVSNLRPGPYLLTVVTSYGIRTARFLRR